MITVFQHICNKITAPLDIEIPSSKVRASRKIKGGPKTFRVEKLSHNAAELRVGPLRRHYNIASSDFEQAVNWLQNRNSLDDPLIRFSTRKPNLDYLWSLFRGKGLDLHHASYIASILDEAGIVELYRDRKTGIRIRLL